MRSGLTTKLLIALLGGLLVGGCAATGGGGGHRAARKLIDGKNYTEAAHFLVLKTAENPEDVAAHRLLGIAQYHLENYPAAKESLQRTLQLNSRDAAAHFYLGLVAERTAQLDDGLFHYQSFLSLRGKGKLADRARRRIEELRQQRALELGRQAIANEREISPAQFSDSTIGVVYFSSRFLSEPLRPLAAGLTELLTTDLAQVRALQVVERLRLNVILDELQLSHAAAFDTTTAPRLGRLLGAVHVLGGSITELPNEQLRIDPNLVNTRSGEVTLPDEAVGAFEQVIQLEKKIVFDIINRLGIQLTKAERDKLAEPPTESFLAFLMYSRGLEYSDQGKLEEARAQYQRAVDADPDFEQAKNKVKLTEILIQTPTTGSVEEFEQFSLNDPMITQPMVSTEHALTNAQDRLGFVPGTRPGQDEPYTGAQSTTGTVIIRGTINDEP